MNEKYILVIEDEPSVGEVVSLYLRRAGFEVTVLQDGNQAITALEEQLPQLVILDIMLPGKSGLEITSWLRARSDVPIIMLTARSTEMDRIVGLEIGADDYVTKPFSPQELVSRVRAVLRRASPSAIETSTPALAFGWLEINPENRVVCVNNQPVSLAAREFDLLFHLARHPNHVFTRDQLLETIWGLADFIDPGTVTVHIRRLREKIETDPANPHHLLTVWGIGYKFEP